MNLSSDTAMSFMMSPTHYYPVSHKHRYGRQAGRLTASCFISRSLHPGRFLLRPFRHSSKLVFADPLLCAGHRVPNARYRNEPTGIPALRRLPVGLRTCRLGFCPLTFASEGSYFVPSKSSFLKYGLWTTGMRITWNVCSIVISWAPPGINESESL